MTAIKLRDYQRDAIHAVFAAWKSGMQRPAIVLPTGAGKTVVFSELIRMFIPWADDDTMTGIPVNHGRRVIVLAHRDELVDQAIAKIRAIAPDLNVGKVKAMDNEITSDVMVCSVQTLVSERRREQVQYSEVSHGNVGLIITDECHHAAAASYKKIYAAFPDALQLGVTATMARGDGVGLGSTWEGVVYKRSILWMISKGYLADVRTKRIDLEALDMGAVKASRGDWAAGDLGQALMDAEADTAIARAYKEHAGERRGIVFTPTVDTAHAAAQALLDAGIPCGVIEGDSPGNVRTTLYEWFRTGTIQVLVNCMVLTEGFDAPWAEVAVIARPTQSAPLYTQMVGRVLRPWPGKKDALVLDLVGASANKLRTLIDLEPGAVQEIRDDETLAEAVEREEAEGNRTVPAGSVAFEMKVKEVGTFESSSTAWVRSEKGVMFIGCGSTYVLLWPAAEAGLWDVVKATPGQKWVRTPYVGLDLGSAMAWAEAVAEDYAEFSVDKGARWRREGASDAQITLAAALGIRNAALMSKGEVSAALERVKGSRHIDRYVRG